VDAFLGLRLLGLQRFDALQDAPIKHVAFDVADMEEVAGLFGGLPCGADAVVVDEDARRQPRFFYSTSSQGSGCATNPDSQSELSAPAKATRRELTKTLSGDFLFRKT